MNCSVWTRSCVVGMAGLAGLGAQAATVDVFAMKDNTIFSSGDLSNGVGQGLFVGTSPNLVERRGLIAFDVAGSVPAGSTITGATLKMYMTQANVVATVSLYRLTQNWGEGASDSGSGGGPGAEGGAGAPAAAGDATWTQNFFGTSSWTTAGGTHSASISASAIGAEGAFTSWSSATLTADVQSMLDSPAQNFGWELITAPVATHVMRYATREYTDPTKRPVLSITYSAVPEPGTMLALGAGSLALLRRRRKA